MVIIVTEDTKALVTSKVTNLQSVSYIEQIFKLLDNSDHFLADNIRKISLMCNGSLLSVQLCALAIYHCLHIEYEKSELSLPKISQRALELYNLEINGHSCPSYFVSHQFDLMLEYNPAVSDLLIDLNFTTLGTTGHNPTLGATGGILVYRLFEIQEELNSHRDN